MKARLLLVALLALSVVGCSLDRILSPDPILPLTEDQFRRYTRNLNLAHEFRDKVVSIVTAAYANEPLLCLDPVKFSNGVREIRSGTPSWCVEAEEIHGLAVDARNLYDGILTNWERAGEGDEQAREEFFVQAWTAYQNVLGLLDRFRQIRDGSTPAPPDAFGQASFGSSPSSTEIPPAITHDLEAVLRDYLEEKHPRVILPGGGYWASN